MDILLNPKHRLRWVLGALVVIGGVLLFFSGEGSTHTNAGDETVPVLIARKYIPAMTSVRPSWLEVRRYPKAYCPPGALHAVGDLTDDSKKDRFLTAIAVPEGQPLTRSVLLEFKKHHGMASVLETGRVAVSMSVDKVHGAGGWIQPGDRIAIFQVDALMENSRRLQSRPKLLFPNVEVVAVDQARIGEDTHASGSPSEDPALAEGDGHVLTLSMNPLEATQLIQARQLGELTVLLRALGDSLPWDDPDTVRSSEAM